MPLLRASLLIFLVSGLIIGQVTLNGVSYPLKDHPRLLLDGSSGALTTELSNTSPGHRAYSGNLPFASLKSDVNAQIAAGYQYYNYDYGDASFYHVLNAALRWQADKDPASLALVIYALQHIEDIMGGSTGCLTTSTFCGGRYADLDYTRESLYNAMQAYSIVRGQMTATDRATFANKVLNDNDSAHNGIDLAACTNQGIYAGTGTLTSSGSVVTIAGGTTAQLAVGSTIFATGSAATLGRIASITDSTHFVTSRPVSWQGISFQYSPAWKAGNCGIIWAVKHNTSAPPLIPAQAASYSANYPPDGGTQAAPNFNLTLTAEFAYVMAGLALADDDSRAATLLTQAYNYYLANNYTYARSGWTGFTQSGPFYSSARTHKYASFIALAIRNSLAGGPDLTGGVYLSRIVPYNYFLQVPGQGQVGLSFMDIYDQGWASAWQEGFWASMLLYPSQSETPFANFYMRNLRGDFGAVGSPYLGLQFLLTDPGLASTDLNGSPTQYVFRATDYASCGTLGLSGCTPNMTFAHAVTRTGWGASDTAVMLQSSYDDGGDHSGVGNWGAVHIYKNGYLLAGDASHANQNRESDNLIELGGGDHWAIYSSPAAGKAGIPRWAGADPTGDAASRYSYALLDFTGAYAAAQGAARVQRQVVHFKKSGFPDYIVWYDDVATTASGTKKALLHFYHADCWNAGSCADGTAGISFSGGSNGGTVTNTQPSSRLLTSVLPAAGNNTALLGNDNPNGTYTGGSGFTYRAWVCAENAAAPGTCDASSTQGEWIVVNKPSGDTSDAMPVLTQPGSTNFRVVQVADAGSPKVAAFAMGGNTYTYCSFTSTFSGTGQYLITGMAPGTYTVMLNGAAITQVTVAANDNTAYFEAGAGAVAVGSASASQVASLVLSPASVTGGASATATVALTAPAPSGGVSVTLGSSNAAVVPATSLMVAAGTSSGQVSLSTNSVTASTPVTLTASANSSTTTASLMVGPAPAPQVSSVSLSPASVTGGTSSTATITLTAAAPTGGVAVTVTSSDGSVGGAALTIPAGSTSGQVTLTTTSVTASTPVTITATANGGPATATLTVNPAQTMPDLFAVTVSPTSVVGGTNVNVTVWLTAAAPSSGATVSLWGSSPAFPTTQVTVASGLTQQTFSLPTTVVSTSTSVLIVLSATFTATQKAANLTVTPGAPAVQVGSLTLSPATVTGGAGVTATVTLSAAAPAGGLAVTISSNNVAASGGSVTVAAGQTSGSTSISTSAVSAATPVTLTASANSSSATAGLTVNPPALPTVTALALSPNSVTGGAGVTATVTLSAAAPAGGLAITISSNNAAVSGGSVTVAAGQTSGSTSISTSAVSSATPVTLTASANSSSATAGLTVNPPALPTVTALALSPNSVTGGTGVTATVTISAAAPAGGLAVTISSNNAAASGGSVTVAAGQTLGSASISTSVVSSATSVTLTASANSSSATAGLTVNPPALPTVTALALSPNSVTGGTGVTATVTISAAVPAGGLAVTISSNNAAASGGSVTVAAGQTSGSASISTSAVSSATPVTLTASANSSSATASLTVNPPALPTVTALALSPTSVTGGAGVTATVMISSAAPAGGFAVTISSNNPAASGGSVTVAAGQTSGSASISTSAVSSATPATLTASANNSSAIAGLTVNPPALPTVTALALSPTSVTGGASVTATVTISSAAPAGGFAVTISSNNPAASGGSVTVAAGQTSSSASISTSAVSAATPVTLTASANSSSATASLTVNPPALPTVTALALSPNSVTGGTGVTATVTISAAAPAGGLAITISSNNVAASGGSVTVAAGQTLGSTSISTSAVSSATPVTLTASANNSSAIAGLTVNPPALPTVISLVLSPSSVTGGAGLTATVTISFAAPAGGFAVTLSSNNAAASGGSVTVAAGQTSGSAPLSTSAVSVVTPVTLTASANNSTAMAGLTVNPPALPKVTSLTLSPDTITGGGTVTAVITLSAAAPSGGFAVTLSSNNAAASGGSVTVAAGQTLGSASISTSVVSSATSVTLTASANSSSATAGLTVNPPAVPTVTSLALSPTSVTGGAGVTATVTISSAAPAGGFAVTLSSNNAAASGGSVTVAAGQTSGSASISTSAVSTPTSVSLTAWTYNSSAMAGLTVNPPALPKVTSLTLSPNTITGGENVIAVITLSAAAPSGGVTVTLSSSNSAVATSTIATVPAGAASVQWTVPTLTVTTTASTTLTASANGGTASAALTANPPAGGRGAKLTWISAFPGTVVGGSNFTLYVNLNAPAPASGATVNVTSSDGSIVQHKFNVTVPRGQFSATFSIPAGTVTTTSTVALVGSYNGGSANTMITVTPH